MSDLTRTEVKDRIELALRRKALIDAASAVLKEDRKFLETSDLAAGERVGDASTGFATMSNPANVVTVVDQDQLDAFLVAEGNALTVLQITDEVAAIAVLREHAPNLVREVPHIPGWAVEAAKARAKAGENIPGIAVRPGSPTLSLRPSAEVKAWAEQSIGDGLRAVGGAE